MRSRAVGPFLRDGLAELGTVIGENRADLIGHGLDQNLEEGGGRLDIGACLKLGKGKL